MRFFITALYLHVKQAVFTKFFLFSAVLSVLLTSACGMFLSARDHGSAVNVGIIYDASSTLQCDIYGNFSASDNIRVITYDSRRDLEKNVESTALECGYILNDVDSCLVTSDYASLTTLIKSPASSLTGFTNEIFYAAVLKSIAGNISYGYLTDIGISVSLEEIRDKIRSYYDGGAFMQTVYINGDGITEPKRVNIFDTGRVLRGAVALAAFVYIFFSSAYVFGENDGKLYLRLTGSSLFQDHAARFLSILLSALLSSLGGIICSVFYLRAASAIAPAEVGFFVLYLFCLTCAGYIITAILGGGALQSAFSAAATAAMVFGGYFFDLAGINAALGKIQGISPAAWYQDAVSGSPHPLIIGAALFTAASLLASALTIFRPVSGLRGMPIIYTRKNTKSKKGV